MGSVYSVLFILPKVVGWQRYWMTKIEQNHGSKWYEGSFVTRKRPERQLVSENLTMVIKGRKQPLWYVRGVQDVSMETVAHNKIKMMRMKQKVKNLWT